MPEYLSTFKFPFFLLRQEEKYLSPRSGEASLDIWSCYANISVFCLLFFSKITNLPLPLKLGNIGHEYIRKNISSLILEFVL